MAHVHDPVLTRPSAVDIAEKARDIHPLKFTGRMLLTLVLFFFTSIGWTVGTAWFVVVFSFLFAGHHLRWCFLAMRYGYHKGARLKVVPRDQG
jgi:uncharacterized membrane protein